MSGRGIRVAARHVSTGVNGPRRRFVLWLQGCRLRCAGCINPEMWDEEGGELIPVEAIAGEIESAPGIEGVTFSGGEPLLQAAALLPLARRVRRRGLGLVLFTGFTMREVEAGAAAPSGRRLARLCDMVIDGPFVEERRTAAPWRGSDNQRVRFLTPRYAAWREEAAQAGARDVEIQVDAGGLSMTGFFEKELWERLKEKVGGGRGR